jgi:DNA-binding CsgD family transcriptional regulator
VSSPDILWHEPGQRLVGDPGATLSVARSAWESLGARFFPADDGQGETPYLATGEVSTAIEAVDIGILDYGDDTTYLLVPGDDLKRPAVTSLVLAALSRLGAIHPDDIVDVVRGSVPGDASFNAFGAAASWKAQRAARQGAPVELSTAKLTPREREVLTLASEGLSNRDIAARLALSPQTVRTHLLKVSEKLGSTGRAPASSTRKS